MSDSHTAYLSTVSHDHRRRYGQFFTPPDIAMFMCRWVLERGAKTLFDPAFGLGSFHSAARRALPSIDFFGMDIDEKVLQHFGANIENSTNLHVKMGDYLAEWNQLHEAIVCNPPYMRFQHFLNRHEAFAACEQHLKIRPSGYTNIASLFLLKSLSELSRGGRLAYIMPLEFLNTGYGEIVKRQLLESGKLKALIKLDPEREIFPDATTSVGVVLVSDDCAGDPVKFYTLSNLNELPDLLSQEPSCTVQSNLLDPSEKWMKYFGNMCTGFPSDKMVPISYYGIFSRGIATGANEFFAMSRSRAEKLGIPRSNFLRCLTKSAQVKTLVFTEKDSEALEDADENVLLLNATSHSCKAVLDYLTIGEEKGFHLRYLTRMRVPWYKLERRNPAPLLFGVFSRNKFKVLRNTSTAVNLTCYHCFYPNLFGEQLCDQLFLYFQSRAARRILSVSMRHYGDGLEKFEPNDLNKALAPPPSWFAALTPAIVSKALESCRAVNSLSEDLEEMFDSLFTN